MIWFILDVVGFVAVGGWSWYLYDDAKAHAEDLSQAVSADVAAVETKFDGLFAAQKTTSAPAPAAK